MSSNFNDSASTLGELSALYTMMEIVDLCQALQHHGSQASKSETCLGYLTDLERRKYTFYSHPPTLHPSTYEFVSLESLINNSMNFSMSQMDRYSIAATIASSILQLQLTPWLEQGWNKRNIFFLRDRSCPDRIIAEKPYISQSFLSSHQNPPCGISSKSSKLPVDVGKSLLSLAIVFCELCLGNLKSLEPSDSEPSPRSGERLGYGVDSGDGNDGELQDHMSSTSDANLKYNTVKKLLDNGSVFRRMGMDYNESVRKCLGVDFFFPPSARTSVDGDKEFRQWIWQNICCPMTRAAETFGCLSY